MDFRWTQNNRAEVTIAHCFRIQSEQYRAEREAAAGQYKKKKFCIVHRLIFLPPVLLCQKFVIGDYNMRLEIYVWPQAELHYTALHLAALVSLH